MARKRRGKEAGKGRIGEALRRVRKPMAPPARVEEGRKRYRRAAQRARAREEVESQPDSV